MLRPLLLPTSGLGSIHVSLSRRTLSSWEVNLESQGARVPLVQLLMSQLGTEGQRKGASLVQGAQCGELRIMAPAPVLISPLSRDQGELGDREIGAVKTAAAVAPMALAVAPVALPVAPVALPVGLVLGP